MLVPAFFAVVSLKAQFGVSVPYEARSPMAIRPTAGEKCRLALSGNAWVGRSTVKGGAIEARDLSGAGVHAAMGVLRFHFANGRYSDLTWRYQSAGTPAMSFRVTPEEAQFDGGLVSPVKIEGRVLGVYFGDEEVCGETGTSIKGRHSRIIEMMRKDSEEALGVANALPPKLFQEAVENGLLDGGPYARESIANTNALLKAKLIGPDGKLIGEYKQWLKVWHDSLRPATPARQKRSSQPRGL